MGRGRNLKSAMGNNMKIRLNNHDQKLVDGVRSVIKDAYESANFSPSVARSIASYATKYRNRGREQAKRRYPFKGICERSGLPLKKEDAHLDELDSEKGYAGKVQWVCPKANNSGRRSCGKC
ncbi:MAG: hypothetical protein AUK17_03280 [Parcubacteria group bacterium CG2_30_44_18]|nr:MAG: hypothetical protein AUK17_03280 [Parcubacteria group bacterium CG2_30_44_18]